MRLLRCSGKHLAHCYAAARVLSVVFQVKQVPWYCLVKTVYPTEHLLSTTRTIWGKVEVSFIQYVYRPLSQPTVMNYSFLTWSPSFSPQTQRYLSTCDTLQKWHCRKKWKGEKWGTPPPAPCLSLQSYFYLPGSNLSSRRGGPSQHGVPAFPLCYS